MCCSVTALAARTRDRAELQRLHLKLSGLVECLKDGLKFNRIQKIRITLIHVIEYSPVESRWAWQCSRITATSSNVTTVFLTVSGMPK